MGRECGKQKGKYPIILQLPEVTFSVLPHDTDIITRSNVLKNYILHKGRNIFFYYMTFFSKIFP